MMDEKESRQVSEETQLNNIAQTATDTDHATNIRWNIEVYGK